MKFRASKDATRVINTGTIRRVMAKVMTRIAMTMLISSIKRFMARGLSCFPAARSDPRSKDHDDQGDGEEADRQGAAVRIIRQLSKARIDQIGHEDYLPAPEHHRHHERTEAEGVGE